jgi:hypothetical protein
MDPVRYGEAGGVFKAYLELLHPEILKMVEAVGFTYIDEAIVLGCLRQQRDIFEALSKQSNIEALKEAAREAKINVKLTFGTEEVLIDMT